MSGWELSVDDLLTGSVSLIIATSVVEALRVIVRAQTYIYIGTALCVVTSTSSKSARGGIIIW